MDKVENEKKENDFGVIDMDIDMEGVEENLDKKFLNNHQIEQKNEENEWSILGIKKLLKSPVLSIGKHTIGNASGLDHQIEGKDNAVKACVISSVISPNNEVSEQQKGADNEVINQIEQKDEKVESPEPGSAQAPKAKSQIKQKSKKKNSKNLASNPNSFFHKPQNKYTASRIEPELALSKEKWVVSIVAHKQNPQYHSHAYLCVEGINADSQLFFGRYDIYTQGGKNEQGKPIIEITALNVFECINSYPNSLLGNNFYKSPCRSFPRSPEQAKALIASIKEQQKRVFKSQNGLGPKEILPKPHERKGMLAHLFSGSMSYRVGNQI